MAVADVVTDVRYMRWQNAVTDVVPDPSRLLHTCIEVRLPFAALPTSAAFMAFPANLETALASPCHIRKVVTGVNADVDVDVDVDVGVRCEMWVRVWM